MPGLIERRTGDAEDVRRFDELFEAHARAVYNFCFRRTADWALAEDLMSIVFLEAWRRRKTGALAGASARPWLLGVAINVIRNQRRSLRRYQAALARIPPAESTRDFAPDADRRLDDEREMARLLDLMTGLSQRDQDVLSLCIASEFTYEQAALALDVPVGTVRSRLSRAKARLRSLGEPPHEAATAASEGTPTEQEGSR